MRLKDTLRALLRRWYVVVAGIAVTAAGCWLVFDQVPVKYEAQGSLVLMPPSATVGDEGNPYLFLGGMDQALDVLSRHVNAAEVAEPVLDDHPSTSYTVEPDRSTSGPIIQVSAVGLTPDATMDVLSAALDTIPVSLDAMQDELSIENHLRIGLMTVVIDTAPTIDDKQRLQLLIVAAAGGIVATVLLAGLIDGLILASRRRKLAAAPADIDNLPEPDPVPTGEAATAMSAGAAASVPDPASSSVPSGGAVRTPADSPSVDTSGDSPLQGAGRTR